MADSPNHVSLNCLDLRSEGDEDFLWVPLPSLLPVNEGDDEFSDGQENASMEDIVLLEPDFVEIVAEAAGVVLDDPLPPKTKPASKTAIEGLENVKIDERSGALYCSVCLEEISIGEEAKRLPCSHVYHTQCIVRWLNENHTCPLCRCEMPVVDFDLNLPPGLDSEDSMMTADN